MARTGAETPSFNNPWERIVHTAHGIPAWAGRHRLQSALTALGLGAAATISAYIYQENGQKSSVQPATGVSDTFNRPDSGLGAIIPTIPTESPPPTATAEPTKTPTPEVVKPKTLPDVISNQMLEKLGIGFVNWTPEEITNKQKELFNNEGMKIPAPKEFFDLGGWVNQRILTNTREESLVFKLNKEETEFTFPALHYGKVTRITKNQRGFVAVRVAFNETTDTGYVVPLGTQILVKEGDEIKPGTLIFTGVFSPSSEAQQKFEDLINARNTAVLFEWGDIATGRALPLRVPNAFLRDDKGNLVTVSSAAGK